MNGSVLTHSWWSRDRLALPNRGGRRGSRGQGSGVTARPRCGSPTSPGRPAWHDPVTTNQPKRERRRSCGKRLIRLPALLATNLDDAADLRHHLAVTRASRPVSRPGVARASCVCPRTSTTVSYTHLTLPTIDSV